MTALPLYDRPTAVYRLFADDNTLLYVGCSCEPDDRIDDHLFKSWGPDIADVDLAWYENRFTALRREAQAITEEVPLYNIQRPTPERIRTPKPTAKPAPRDSGLTFAQVAEEVDIPVHWLWRGVANGKLPHSCLDPEGDDVWFAQDDIRDLHVIYDLPPIGLGRQRVSTRVGIRRALRFKRCSHAAI
jgi:hypothetical protein